MSLGADLLQVVTGLGLSCTTLVGQETPEMDKTVSGCTLVSGTWEKV